MRVSDLNGRPGAAGSDIYVLDTHGDLTALYAAADLTLLGGTFAPHGGHNPNESARYGVPVVTGPFTENIAADLALLDSAGLCFRLEEPSDFPRLAGALEGAGGAAACERLSALLARRPDPSALLAQAVAAELSRDA